MPDVPTPPAPPQGPGAGRYTGRLFLDGADAALFLRQHGDMVAAVERMAAATELVASSSTGLAADVRRLEGEAAQDRARAGADAQQIHEQLDLLARRFGFWSVVGRFSALVVGFGVVGIGVYGLVRAVL